MNVGAANPLAKAKPSDHRSDQSTRTRTEKAKNPVVYFLRVEQGEYLSVKIGFATNFDKRIYQHQNTGLGIRPKIEPICVLKASRQEEDAIHDFFAKYRKPGRKEEFEPVPELVDYIRWLRDNHFVWVPDDSAGAPIESLPLVQPEFWMPREGTERRKADANDLLKDSCLSFAPRILTIDDFYTNQIIIDAARKTLGGIDLDPSSHPIANRVVGATRIFTKFDDGLSREWGGRVWLNPPFSTWAAWASKVVAEWQSGRIEAMCVLCATRTLTAQYFRKLKDASDAICILDGRIPFWGDLAGDSPDDGHAVFYFGSDAAKFHQAFSEIGTVWITPRKVSA